MSDDPLEREVRTEAEAVLVRWERFMGRPLAVRLLMTLSLAAAVLALSGGLVFALAVAGDRGQGGTIFAVLVTACVVVPMAVWAAVAPRSYIHAVLRRQMSPPTRSPGYNTWQGPPRRND